MAYIAHGAGQNVAFPSVWQDVKYPKDIVINGILFDIDTFTPKIGSRVINWTGNYGINAAKTWTMMDDDDIYYFGIWHNDNIASQYAGAIFAPNYPMVSRAVKSDYTNENAVASTMMQHATNCNTSLWHRDWLDHPLKTWHYNYTIDEYLGMWPYQHESGARAHYDGSGGKMCYMDGTYRTQGAEIGYNIIDPETSSGMLFRQLHNSTTQHSQQLAVINYTSEADLRSVTKTELYGVTSTSSYIHHLTKCNNGDHFFLAHEGSGANGGNNFAVDILRYNNSTNSITEEYTNIGNSQQYYYPFSVPSNVVYHQESGESTTSKKICYYYTIGTATFDWSVYNNVKIIEMDIDAATITRTTCTHTHPAVDNTDDDMADARVSAAVSLLGPEWIIEARIISASQAIDSQKYLLLGVINNGTYSKSHDRPYMMMKIDASDATILTAVTGSGTYGKWNDILTTSPNLVNDYDAAPWCLAPLNTEHTLMMVFTKYSTHVLKFDTSTETMSEVWYDHYTVFQQVMWMPSGKVITAEWEKDFAVGSATVDLHAPTPLQVWAEDLVYNVSITTDSDYVTYAGSDITNTLSISAQDATDSNVETDLTLQIIGPALFDNSAKTKTVTTSKTADVTETLTINDDGHIEVKVVEIQSQ